MDTALLWAIATFLAGVIFASGVLAARVKHLEDWRAELRGDLERIREELHDIRELLSGRRVA